MTRSKQPLAALLAALLFAVTASCSTNDNNNDDDAADPTPSPESEVEAAYLAYWEMGARLLEAPDPADPEIPQRTSGEALTNLVNGLTTLKETDQRSELGRMYSHDVIGVRVDGASRAEVDDCAVDDSRVVNATTGEVVAEGLVTELLRVTLIRDDERWLVDHTSRVDAWEGATDCG
ncbi:MAG TPA: hypothetical protein VK611_21775 [Acidimicrobiales bacterium]|nr:hypothetical protein [Acidimicrobiales bacterium]